MNWDAIGAAGEIMGALAVFASLVYLAVQIRHTSRQLQNQIENELHARVYQAYDPVYEGRNAEIMFAGLRTPEGLESTDGFVFDLLMHRQSAAMAQIARQIELDSLSPEEAQAFANHYRTVFMNTPGGRAWFRNNPQAAQHSLDAMGIEIPSAEN